MAKTKENTLVGKLGDWQKLLEPLKANAADLAHLEGSRLKLDALLTQTIQLQKEQAAATASKQDVTLRLTTGAVEGQRLANLLRQAVKEHYGIRSEKLAEFGMQPFRGRSPKKPPAPEVAPTPAPRTSPPAAAPLDPSH